VSTALRRRRWGGAALCWRKCDEGSWKEEEEEEEQEEQQQRQQQQQQQQEQGRKRNVWTATADNLHVERWRHASLALHLYVHCTSTTAAGSARYSCSSDKSFSAAL
jgi:hypothetical protein